MKRFFNPSETCNPFRLMAIVIFCSIMSAGVFAGPVLAESGYSGSHLKPVVAVSRFDDRSSYNSGAEYSLSNALTDQLTDALIQTDAFIVLERQVLQDVLAEQDFAAGDRVSQSQSARIGQLTGAQVLVMGTVTDFDLQEGGRRGGLNIGGVRLGGNKQTAHVGLIVRLVDATTGEVLDSQRISGKAESRGATIGLDIGGIKFDGADFSSTPLGEASQEALDEAVAFIAREARKVPFQARVVEVDDRTIVISAGSRNNVQQGAQFTVMSVGRELTDPFTGELLGYDQSPIGRISVNRVFDRFAYADGSSLSGAAKIGDFVVIELGR
ncbi:MAG: hypothetical protein LC637_01575 [Xanthomonadaceae bacterium]|nr:hypothetical protein [Xanthomonadaceae bacterium]